jgi:hypothetical protein
MSEDTNTAPVSRREKAAIALILWAVAILAPNKYDHITNGQITEIKRILKGEE